MAYVFAKATTAVGSGSGMTAQIHINQTWKADDPVVLANPDLFSSEPVLLMTSDRGFVPVEAATAAPGERRKIG